MKPQIRERAGQLFAALAHPVRLRIVELLFSGEKTVNEIAEGLALSQSGTSQHLAILARAGVLAVEPRGTSRIYRVRGPRIQRILDLIEEFCQVHELYGIPEDKPEEQPEEQAESQAAEQATGHTKEQSDVQSSPTEPQ